MLSAIVELASSTDKGVWFRAGRSVVIQSGKGSHSLSENTVWRSVPLISWKKRCRLSSGVIIDASEVSLRTPLTRGMVVGSVLTVEEDILVEVTDGAGEELCCLPSPTPRPVAIPRQRANTSKTPESSHIRLDFCVICLEVPPASLGYGGSVFGAGSGPSELKAVSGPSMIAL